MTIKTFISTGMTKIRNSPALEQPKKIELLSQEGIRLGHDKTTINVLITENIIQYMKDVAKMLRSER